MSPRNWSVCPQCSLRRSMEIDKFDKDLQNKYGKISLEDFERLKLTRPRTLEKETLAEYYEFWFSKFSKLNNEFVYHFHFTCDQCGFSLDHKDSTKVNYKNIDEDIRDEC